MRPTSRYALLALALALAVAAARPIEDKPLPPRSVGLLRRLLQLNSTQTTGPWAEIVGTTASAMPGYYPRLNLTRNGTTYIAASSVSDPLRISAFPGQSAYPAPVVSVTGTLQAGGGGLASIADFNDPAVVGPPGT